jgi:hypothetical protein
MGKYLIIVIILVIAVVTFLILRKRNPHGKIESYTNIKAVLKDTPNKSELPIANIEELDMEVNNGGFNQYFFNSSGQNCFETLRELRKLGKNKKAELLEKAIELVNPNRLSEKEMIEKFRQRKVAELEDPLVSSKLDSLDQIYFRTPE